MPSKRLFLAVFVLGGIGCSGPPLPNLSLNFRFLSLPLGECARAWSVRGCILGDNSVALGCDGVGQMAPSIDVFAMEIAPEYSQTRLL